MNSVSNGKIVPEHINGLNKRSVGFQLSEGRIPVKSHKDSEDVSMLSAIEGAYSTVLREIGRASCRERV